MGTIAMSYENRELKDLIEENKKLWAANKELAQSFTRLVNEIKRLKRNGKTLKDTVEMWQRAEAVAFAEIDEVLKNIDNLNEGKNYE